MGSRDNYSLGGTTTLYKYKINLKNNNDSLLVSKEMGGPEKSRWWVWVTSKQPVYLELVYLVTALVPSDTACLASSPGRSRRTAVWISREVMVDLLL